MLTSVILRRSLRTTRCCVPVADRPECRAIGPCLKIQHHCQEIPCAGAPRERIRVSCAMAAARGALSSGLRSVRPRNRRMSTGLRPQSAARVVQGGERGTTCLRRALRPQTYVCGPRPQWRTCLRRRCLFSRISGDKWDSFDVSFTKWPMGRNFLSSKISFFVFHSICNVRQRTPALRLAAVL
jgi:hypothetical protein